MMADMEQRGDDGNIGQEWTFRSPGAPGSIVENDPRSIPAVRAALEQGLQLAPASPMWAFLPLVWPGERCYWVADIRVRTMVVACDDQPSTTQYWSTADYASIDEDSSELIRQCGLPQRPAGRVWLLDTGGADIDQIVDDLVQDADSAGIAPIASERFARFVSARLPHLLHR